MARKPTYKKLEKEIVSKSEQIRISDINIEWNVKEGTCKFENLPVAMMWVDTTLAGLRHLHAIEKHGLRVDSVNGDFTIHQASVTDNPAMVGEVDVIFCCVKSWQVSEAAMAMRPMIGPNTMVVPMQNGVEAPTILSDVLVAGKVLGDLCRIISMTHDPGHIRHVGAKPHINSASLIISKPNARRDYTEHFPKLLG